MHKNLHKPTDKLLTSLSILNSKVVWNSQSKHCYFVFYPGSYPLLFPNPSSKCHTRNCKCYRDTWTSLLSYEHMCKVGCTLYYSFSELSNDIIRIFWFFSSQRIYSLSIRGLPWLPQKIHLNVFLLSVINMSNEKHNPLNWIHF